MEALQKIPFTLITAVVAVYLGLQLYEFEMGPTGAVMQHEASKVAKLAEIDQLRKKKAEAEKFYAQIEVKRQELYAMIDQLNNLSVSLSDGLEVPALIRLIVTEAKNSGIRVEKIEPGTRQEKEFYIEQEFRLTTKGTYVQIVSFLDRLAQLKRILRVEGYDIAPKNQSNSKYILSEGKLSVRAYQYARSQADDLYNELKNKKEVLNK